MIMRYLLGVNNGISHTFYHNGSVFGLLEYFKVGFD